MCLKIVIHQIDSKNKLLLLSASFTAKLVLVFVNTGKLFLKPTERTLFLLETVLGISKTALRLRDRHDFM